MSLITKAREFFRPGGLVCLRCEKPLEGHDEKTCARRMSRRYFFGALAGGLAAAAVLPKVAEEFQSGAEIMARWREGDFDYRSNFERALAEMNGMMDRWRAEGLSSQRQEIAFVHGVFYPRLTSGMYFLDRDGIKMWPEPKDLSDAGGMVTITQHVPKDRVFEFTPKHPYPWESSGWADPNGLKPGDIFTMAGRYVENPPSRGRRCPAYNERTGAWDKSKRSAPTPGVVPI